jgi:hypothetical protein
VRRRAIDAAYNRYGSLANAKADANGLTSPSRNSKRGVDQGESR